MALTTTQINEITRKAELGIPLLNTSNPEAVRLYNQVRETMRKAKAGIPLVNSGSYFFNSLYTTYLNGNVTGGKNIGQGTPVNTGGTVNSGGAGAPVLDQTKPDIIENTNNAPMTNIGTGINNPTNKLEINTIVGVVAGFFFIRGAFKLLTKFF